ncbi:hypothetical protein AAFC00_002885 [Neodothiora populina]|uniref:Peptidase S53 domain-containing protein n=1 Tax=Neodothiora populina TaxID=2781224 RepID=A0ABR3P8V1_9PEZI
MLFSVFALGAILSLALASPVGNYAVHERRDRPAQGWNKLGPLPRSVVLPIRIALAQRNLDSGYKYLEEVSHPESEKYGQHWSAKDVAAMFSPDDETVDLVKEWLATSGISNDRTKLSQGRNWISFNATAEEAESLLKTEYHVYEHTSGTPHVACQEYSLPTHLKEKIDFVLPSTHFDARIDRTQRAGLTKRQHGNAKDVGKPGSYSTPRFGNWLSKQQIISELANCDEQIVPDCLRALYKFPKSGSANHKNSYGIVEYSPQSYLPSDLDLFFSNFSSKQVGDRPKLDSIDGGVLQTEVESFDYNGESDLDLQYAMSLVYPLNVTLYQVGDLVEGASFNNFLDALDASYCAGDDPSQDGVYPDPYTNYSGAYEGPETCGGFAAAKVISTSYSYNEADLTPAYEMRQCNEYMKLGLMGSTFLYSSGDYGVAGNGGQCINDDGSYNNGTSGKFNPSFPSSCPYVLSIGATQVKDGVNILDALASGTQPEEASETVIYSGGGFSNVFPIPSYQKSAVHGFLSKHTPPYGPDRFNNSGNTRAFPDVSANGANYVVAVDGEFALVYGTSASSPTFGSVLTLINDARLNAGKSSIGFINPTLYAHPEVLNDVTEGGNQGCGTNGFSSAKGWDPVTGLGTPNYPKMKSLFLSLP